MGSPVMSVIIIIIVVIIIIISSSIIIMLIVIRRQFMLWFRPVAADVDFNEDLSSDDICSFVAEDFQPFAVHDGHTPVSNEADIVSPVGHRGSSPAAKERSATVR